MVFLLQIVLLKTNKGGNQNLSVSETVNANNSNELRMNFLPAHTYVQNVYDFENLCLLSTLLL